MAIPLSMVSLCQFSAYGSDGHIDFQGEIITTSCEIKPSTQNQSISLGKVSVKGFTAKNSTSLDDAFSY
ncbi:MAG: fimbrial protein [Arsenophonus endosymbiont of Dermacentor nuttalli]